MLILTASSVRGSSSNSKNTNSSSIALAEEVGPIVDGLSKKLLLQGEPPEWQ